jgi:hypothetical protein
MITALKRDAVAAETDHIFATRNDRSAGARAHGERGSSTGQTETDNLGVVTLRAGGSLVKFQECNGRVDGLVQVRWLTVHSPWIKLEVRTVCLCYLCMMYDRLYVPVRMCLFVYVDSFGCMSVGYVCVGEYKYVSMCMCVCVCVYACYWYWYASAVSEDFFCILSTLYCPL